ncbi:MAG TPA: hypothetical protein VHA52_11355 [Candidatus Babeliaceae bacterium]|nr:hypothetical protein [Candidatus Babeliaceae bacterium]
MSLDTTTLKNDIKTAMATQRAMTGDTTGDSFAENLATAIKQYVLQLDISYTGGLTAPNGNVEGDFNFSFT